jgi:uncharacterized protein
MDNWALITGASAGIGRELAWVFAENHYHVVLVARDEARLQQLAGEISSRHGVQARVLPQDLSRPKAAAELFQAANGIPVSVLVNNAGLGAHGEFAGLDLAKQTEIMQVNMVALVQLTHLFLQPMLQRREGRILNVASVAAFQPGPTMNIYSATKAFVYSFSRALEHELKGTHVSVTTLCPGTTRTEFFARARLVPGSFSMDARSVAEAGFRGLMRGRRVVIPGMMNRIVSMLGRHSPVALTNPIVRRFYKSKEPGSARA